MSEAMKELRAALVAAKEEANLFREILSSIDPKTGRPLTVTDPGERLVSSMEIFQYGNLN